MVERVTLKESRSLDMRSQGMRGERVRGRGWKDAGLGSCYLRHPRHVNGEEWEAIEICAVVPRSRVQLSPGLPRSARTSGAATTMSLTSSSSVPHPSFSFGGKSGTTVCTVAFQKMA